MEKYAIDFNTKAPRKRLSPAYKTSVNRAYEYRKKGKQLWEQLSPEERKIRSRRLRELERAEKSMTPTVPLDANYKRIQYTRYADDFLIGVIGSKEDAEQVRRDVKAFLQDSLKLEMSDTKTKVTHTGDRARFLGYDITVSRSQNMKKLENGKIQRCQTGVVKLLVPGEKAVYLQLHMTQKQEEKPPRSTGTGTNGKKRQQSLITSASCRIIQSTRKPIP